MSVGFVSLLQIHTPQFFVGSKPPSCGINIDKPSPSSDLLLFINDYGVYTHVYPIPIILVNYVAYFAKYTPPKRGCLPPPITPTRLTTLCASPETPLSWKVRTSFSRSQKTWRCHLRVTLTSLASEFGVLSRGQVQNRVQLTALTYQTWGLVASKMRFSQHN